MEVGGEGDYIPIATLSPPSLISLMVSVDVKHHVTSRMTPALRWAKMRAILKCKTQGRLHSLSSPKELNAAC